VLGNKGAGQTNRVRLGSSSKRWLVMVYWSGWLGVVMLLLLLELMVLLLEVHNLLLKPF